MIIFIVVLAVVVLLSTRSTKGAGRKTIAEILGADIKGKDTAEPFLSQRSTTIINGIFVLLIFFSHSTGYFTLSDNPLDSLYRHFQNFHNQWVVTTFLAFSGYGVMKKTMREGYKYLEKFLKNRLLKTLFNFDIAVIIYLIVTTALGEHYDAGIVILSFIGYESVGNSNWYIFTILLMYLVSYAAGIVIVGRRGSVIATSPDTADGPDKSIPKRQGSLIATIVTVCAASYVVIAQITGLPSRFVSTVMTYALGVWITIYRDEIKKLFEDKPFATLIIICIPILATYKLRGSDYIMNINSSFFVMAVLWFMTHFEIRSDILYFMGKHAFSIYILQRIPMIIISHYYTPSGMMNYVFAAVCLAITVGISVLFDKFLPVIDKKIIKV